MSTEQTAALNALEGFATHLETFWTDQPFHTQMGGWNTVPIRTTEMAARVRDAARRIGEIGDDAISEVQARKIGEIPDHIAWFQGTAIPQLASSNLSTVLANFDYLLTEIERTFPDNELFSWERISRSDLVPKELSRRLRSLEATLSRLEPKAEVLAAQVKVITDAHQAALDLPTDLQSLDEARREISQKKNEVASLAEAVSDILGKSEEKADSISQKEDEARNLVESIESAYSAATTKGLAASFTERERNLTLSIRYWVVLLGIALVGAATIGYYRLNAFQGLAETSGVDPQVLWVNAAMSLLSVAAPIWFAWLATRQIGQRFRLAEDYAFKASVARAYEGYRKEAARLDTELEARLFASALDRLDEAPLRFLSREEHGSPYEALLASAGFQKALERIPSLREAMSVALDRATSRPGRQRASRPQTDTAQNTDVAG